jgi:adenosine deaminase
VGDNFSAIQIALNVSDDEIVQLARNSFEASFLDEAEQARHLADLDRVM